MRHILSVAFTLLLSFNCLAFQGELLLSNLYKQILNSEDTDLLVEKRFIKDDVSPIMLEDSLSFYEALESKLGMPIPYDSLGLITSINSLSIVDSKGEYIVLDKLNIDTIYMRGNEITSLMFDEINSQDLFFDSLIVTSRLRLRNSNIGSFSGVYGSIQDIEFSGNTFSQHFFTSGIDVGGNIWISDSKFSNGMYLGAQVEGAFIDLLLENCEFETLDSELSFLIDEETEEELVMKTPLRINLFGDVDQAFITDNVFAKDTVDQYIYLEGDYDYMVISGNEFGAIFHPVATVLKQLSMGDNIYHTNLIFTDFILQGKNNDLKWEEISGFKLAATINYGEHMSTSPEEYGYGIEDANQIFIQTADLLQIPYRAINEEELADQELFQQLISSYYRLYKTFKDNGQIDDANKVYIEMKDVQLRELSYLYHSSHGLEAWIQWQLNSILRLYTNYGTNPAKAIKISIWVVAIFSIFYFFFPSEWDTKSKAQLIVDYRIFIEKNDKGYLQPFIKLSYGFMRSMMNAFTLSLNSFVTLGFGTIPTTGLARYVCILQGFLGWFLLSIFTASLINQVLF